MASATQTPSDSVSLQRTSMLARGMLLSFGGEAIRIVLTFLYGVAIARGLGAEDYGIFFLGVTTLNLAAGLFSYRPIEDTLIRFIGQYAQTNQIGRAKATIRLSLLTGFGSSVFFGLIFFFLADPIAVRLFHKPHLAIVLRYFSIGFPFYTAMTICVASTKAFRDLKSFVIVNKIALHVLTFLFSGGVLLMGGKLRGLTMAYNLAMLCCSVLAARFLISFLARYNRVPAAAPELKPYFSYLGSVCLIDVFLFLFGWSDLTLVAVLLPSRDTGIYTAAKKTAVVMHLLYIALNAIFAPTVSHHHGAGEHDQLNQAFKTAARWTLTLSMPVYLVIVLFSRELLGLYGAEFREGAPALILMATGCFVHVGVGSTEYVLMMTGRQRWMAVNAVIMATISIGLGIWIVPRHGMVGAAWINAGMFVAANAAALVQAYLLLRVHPFHRKYFEVILYGAVTAAVVGLLRQRLAPFSGTVIPLILACAVFIIYGLLILLFGLDTIERDMLKSARGKLAVFLRARSDSARGGPTTGGSEDAGD